MRPSRFGEQADGLLVMGERLVAVPAPAGHDPGLLQELGPWHDVIGELGGPFVVPPCLLGGPQGRRPPARPGQGITGPAPDIGGVGGVGGRPVRVQEVRRHHLHHLVLVVPG